MLPALLTCACRTCRQGYERDLLRQLQRLVAECDRKIEKAQERADLDTKPKPLTPQQQAELDALKAQSKMLTERSEQLAEAGDVDGSMAAVAQVGGRAVTRVHPGQQQPGLACVLGWLELDLGADHGDRSGRAIVCY